MTMLGDLQLMLENFLGFLVFKDVVPFYNIALQCAKEV
jgi:hypothetical protein